jgi:predicted porin
MKKHLIAAAVAAAVAVPAAAQVTVYGAIGYHSQTLDKAEGDVTTQSTGTNNLGSPVIGFKGSEDLGGGLKASFNLEGGLNTNDGNWGGGSDNVNSNQTFDRQSWVGISGGFGALKFGRTANATKDIEGLGDVGANLFDLGGAVDTYTDRFGSTVHYKSPSFSGVTVTLSNTQGKSATVLLPEAGEEVNAYNVTYKAGPLTVAAGKADARTAAGVDVGNTLLGASYNAGFATFELGYQTEKTANRDTDKLTQIGAIVPVGKAISIRANISKLDKANETDGDIDYKGVMAVYSLSKRTRAFAGYRDDSYGTGGTSKDQSVSTFGLIHSF